MAYERGNGGNEYFTFCYGQMAFPALAVTITNDTMGVVGFDTSVL